MKGEGFVLRSGVCDRRWRRSSHINCLLYKTTTNTTMFKWLSHKSPKMNVFVSQLYKGVSGICKLSPDLLFSITATLLWNLKADKQEIFALWHSLNLCHTPRFYFTDRYVQVFDLSGTISKINQMFYFNRTCQYHTLIVTDQVSSL